MGSEYQSNGQRKRKKSSKALPNVDRRVQNKYKPAMYSAEIQIAIGDTLYSDDTHKYTVEEYLSNGQYGKVFRVLQNNKPGAKSLACKVQLAKFKNESNIHRLLSHKHIVKFLHSFCSDRYCFIFMEYYKNGTLDDLVRKRDGLTVFESRYFFHQINLGVKYMHKMKIIHRDLKLDNIFLAKNMQIKIGDFGIAIHVNATQNKRTRSNQNRNHYKAPELFNGENYSTASDIWAEGVILYRMIFNRGPFKIDENFMAATKYKFDFELENNDDLYDVLNDIFQPIHLRSNVRQCLNSKFLCNSKIPKKLPNSIRTEPINEITDSDPSYELS